MHFQYKFINSTYQKIDKTDINMYLSYVKVHFTRMLDLWRFLFFTLTVINRLKKKDICSESCQLITVFKFLGALLESIRVVRL